MAKYNLTTGQKDLLTAIVKDVLLDKKIEPLITDLRSTIIGIGDFGPNLMGDLKILYEVDLLGERLNSNGNPIYTVKQSAYDAVESDFVLPEHQAQTQINIGTIMRDAHGGTIQSVGFSSHSEITQAINDPTILSERLDELTEQILSVVKSELSPKELLEFIKTLGELKEQIQNETPSASILQKLFASISFIGDVESGISLATRVWPYVYPLLLLASQKLAMLAG